MKKVTLPPFKVETPDNFSLSETWDWGQTMHKIPELHQKGFTGKGIKVAVLDTGIDETHPDLKDNILIRKSWISGENGGNDQNGHGTHCAGIIAAAANGIGIKGVAPDAKLIIAQTLDKSGSGYMHTNVEAGYWAIEKGAQIISMSLGGSQPSTALERAIHDWVNKRVIVVVAAGNSGAQLSYPGKYPVCITVGAHNQNKQKAWFSAVGKELDILAPGTQILSTYKYQSYAKLSGTSMATPFVAGMAALIKQMKPNVNQTEMEFLLRNTAIDIGKIGKDEETGHGIINPKQMLIKEESIFDAAPKFLRELADEIEEAINLHY